MKSLITRSFFLLLLSSCWLSCKHDQNEALPELKFKSLKDGDVLWNSVNLELSMPNQASIAKVEIMVNSKVLFTLNQSPFISTWNTLDVEDGEYELKAVTTNLQGAQQFTKINTTVQNALVSFTVPNDHLRSSSGQVEKGWVFVSSSNGEVIGVSEFQNGDKIKITNPEYNGKSFMLSEAYLRNGVTLDISSYEEVSRGKWTLAKIDDGRPVIGQLAITFKDSVGIHPYYVSTTGDSKLFYEGGNSILLNVNQSPSRLFVREIGNDVNHYNLVSGLTPADSYTGQFSQLNKALTLLVSPSLMGAEAVGVRLYGFPNHDSFDESYQLGVFILNQGTVKIEYPGTEFPVYGSDSFFRGNGIRINSFHPTKMYDISPLKAQVIFADKSNTSATLATFGDFDIYVIGWGYIEKLAAFSWVLTGGAGKSEYLKLPELPSAILNAGTVNFKTSSLDFLNVVQIADYEIATDYRSYIQYISKNGFNSPYTFGKAWKEQVFSANGVTGGGRRNLADLPTIKERLSRR